MLLANRTEGREESEQSYGEGEKASLMSDWDVGYSDRGYIIKRNLQERTTITKTRRDPSKRK